MTSEPPPLTSVEVKINPEPPVTVEKQPDTRGEIVSTVLWSMVYAFGELFIPIDKLNSNGENNKRIIIESTNKRIEKNRDTLDLIKKTEALRHREIEALEIKVQDELRKVPRKDRNGAAAKKHKEIANGHAKLKRLYMKDLEKIQARLYIMVKNELVEKGTILDMEIAEYNEEFVETLDKKFKYMNLDQVEDTKDKMKEHEDKAIDLNKAVTADISGELMDDGSIEDELDLILDNMDKEEEEEIEKSTLKVKALTKAPSNPHIVEKQRIVDDEMEELKREMVAQ